MRDGLRPLLAAIREKGTPPDTSVLQGTFDTDAQASLCNAIAKELGFNLDCGRLDVSVHPFTGGACSSLSCSLNAYFHDPKGDLESNMLKLGRGREPRVHCKAVPQMSVIS